MKKTLLICATALLVVSCSKDTTETLEAPEAKPQGIIFSAAQDNDTRTKLDGVNILWQRGDAVGIFSPQIAEAVNYKAVIAEEDHDKQFATLRTDLNYNGSGEHAFYAYYPYVEGQTAATKVKGSISASQNGEIGSNAFMWATATVDPATMPRVDLLFQHPFTYLNIQLRATGEYQGATVERIHIEASEGKTLAGDFEADLTRGAVTFTTHERSVAVAPVAVVLGNDYQNTLVVVNAEDLTGTDFIVSITLRQNGNVVKLRTVKAGRLLKPQTKVNLKLTVEEMEIDRSDDAIEFADATAETICLNYWDKNNDGRLSYKEAADVQRLSYDIVGNLFQDTNISSFNELQYFKGLTSIDEYAFSGCVNMRSIIIPENVTSIEEGAFAGTGLSSIEIPDHVKSIGRGAFPRCEQLTDVTIGNGIETIPDDCFDGCRSLANIVIPDNVTSIGFIAFAGTGLRSIKIPDNVESIGQGAFSDCEQLTDVTIGNGIETIPMNCFAGCNSLANIVIPDNVTSIGQLAFGESGLTSIKIPNSVTVVDIEAFSFCEQLTDVTIGNGIETIPAYCFEMCSSLKRIVIGTNVKSIEWYAFSNCNSLADIVLPDNLTSISWNAFEHSGLTSIEIPDKVMSIDPNAFSGCEQLTDVTIGNGLETIPASCFVGCSNLTQVNIGTGVKSINNWAFSHCSSLANIDLPDNVTIENNVFEDSGLTSIVIPNNATLNDNAFFGCKKLTDVTIGNGIETIPAFCFGGCSSLKRIEIGTNVQSIKGGAFGDSYSLTDVYCRAITPPTCDGAFRKEDANLYVPTESVDSYREAAGWKEFSQIIGYDFGNL